MVRPAEAIMAKGAWLTTALALLLGASLDCGSSSASGGGGDGAAVVTHIINGTGGTVNSGTRQARSSY
jgi:hypothetical protein